MTINKINSKYENIKNKPIHSRTRKSEANH